MPLLEARGIKKVYKDAPKPLEVLRGIDISIDEGEVIGIFGASGAGKSTLLHIIGGIDSPDEGSVFFRNEDVFLWKDKRLASFRNESLGFVFQFYHLLAEFSALENVMVPLLISGMSKSDARKRSKEILSEVGLEGRLDHRPAMLSGGEQQRVAIARAVVMNPNILLADEPTGNLDSENGEEVWKYLNKIQETRGMAMIVVSHNPELIKSMPKKYEIVDGMFK